MQRRILALFFLLASAKMPAIADPNHHGARPANKRDAEIHLQEKRLTQAHDDNHQIVTKDKPIAMPSEHALEADKNANAMSAKAADEIKSGRDDHIENRFRDLESRLNVIEQRLNASKR